ncbi:MAG: hypothetical protein H7Y86_12120 [Rhizobacter sp.]|nr:hypothetical protein [Ferruginibacter sp.]
MKKSLFSIAALIPAIVFAQNVGIGTPAPENKLHIVSTDSNAVKIEKNTPLDAGSSNGLYFKNGDWFTGAIKQIGASTAASRTGIFGYAAQNTADLREHISILDGGNVGIGTTLPTQKLVVIGNAIVSGHLTSNTLQSATSLQVGTTILAGGNITTSAGVFLGNTTTATNGGMRFNTTDSKVEYREDNSWKRMTKPFFQSSEITHTSSVRNINVVHPTFEFIIPEDGNYYFSIQTDIFPVLKTDGCVLQYIDLGGATWLYSKTRGAQFLSFNPAGSYKWHLTSTGSCVGGTNIPLMPNWNQIVYCQKNEVMTLSYRFTMNNPPGGTLDPWQVRATVNYVKVD